MRLCGTCKHWGTTEDTGHRFRQCQAVVHDDCGVTDEPGEDSTPLEQETFRKEGRKEQLIKIRDTALAVVKDGSGYFGAMKSRCDFGCVLHEPKEPQP